MVSNGGLLSLDVMLIYCTPIAFEVRFWNLDHCIDERSVQAMFSPMLFRPIYRSDLHFLDWHAECFMFPIITDKPASIQSCTEPIILVILTCGRLRSTSTASATTSTTGGK